MASRRFLQGVLDGVAELVNADRFGQIVVSPLAQTVKGDDDIGGPGDHDYAKIRMARGNIF